MKDLEEKVRAMKVVEPSTELDRRIARLLSGRKQTAWRIPFAYRNIPLWGCTAACVLALFAGVLLGRSTAPSEPQMSDSVSWIYVIDGGDRVTGNLFDWTDQEDHFLESASGEDIHVAISQGPNAG